MILLIGNYAYDRQESMQRFANMLLAGLQQRGVRAELIIPQPFFGRLKPSGNGIGKWLGYVDKYLIFPLQLRRRIRQLKTSTSNSDSPASATSSSTSNLNSPLVVHICDHSNAHYTRYLKEVAHLVTCNDVLALRSARGDFPENRTRWSGRQYQRLILRGLNRAQHVACISANTREELIEIGDMPTQNTSVVEMGLNYPYSPLARPEAKAIVDQSLVSRGLAQLGSSPFLMHIGGNQWYKNREGLVRIYLELLSLNADIPPLFLLGADLTDNLGSLISDAPTGYIAHLGKVSNEELRAFYTLAEALIFPSKREGFGWPIIEAQACGCRVATSDRPPMNDIGGEAAVYFDPEDSAQAAKCVMALLRESEEARRRRVEIGLQNANRFTTEQMLDQYCELYESLLDVKLRVPAHV